MDRDKSEPEPPARVGWFGGTFNPIHVGHLLAVQEAAHRLDLPRVVFIPTHRPPHKQTPRVSTKHRLQMTRLAVRSNPLFDVSDVETRREGPSYTVQTLEDLDDTYATSRQYFLTGADELIDFKNWHRWEHILERVQMVGMNRPGFPVREVPDPVRDRTRFVEVPSIDVSSSEIRNRVKRSAPVRYFVPDIVHDYIQEHGLYRAP